jgi:general stress protein 26
MNAQKELQAFVDKQELCFLGSITKEGYPMIRAMLKPIKIDDNVHQNMTNSKACVYFYDAKNFTGISLIGKMEVLSKEADKIEFWQDQYHIYYEQGEGLSDFTVLKFTFDQGEFYQDFQVTTF